jgi:hypothetical protein
MAQIQSSDYICRENTYDQIQAVSKVSMESAWMLSFIQVFSANKDFSVELIKPSFLLQNSSSTDLVLSMSYSDKINL